MTVSKREAEKRDGSDEEPDENMKWKSSSQMGPGPWGDPGGGTGDPVWQGPSHILCLLPLKQRCQGKLRTGRAARGEAMSRDREL